MRIDNDIQGMELALQWAAKSMFITTPNPRVGCVIVKDGTVIGAGNTQPPGQAHAEVQAMNDALSRGHDLRGSTAYVTLEPCSHFGRTPPCADALVKAGEERLDGGPVHPDLVEQRLQRRAAPLRRADRLGEPRLAERARL